jgi:quinol monooxygenase YgiN
MGGGASTQVAQVNDALTSASDADLQKFLADLPEEDSKKLIEAMSESKGAKLEWKDRFVVVGQYTCKDIPLMTKASLKDAAIQVKEEPRAPRMTIMGLATNETPPEDAKDNIFWLAEFECMDAWAGPDHKERETNKEFSKDMMASGASAEEGPPGMVKDMAGSYTGPAFHLEKPGLPSGENDVFACLMKVKAKDEESAEKIVELLKGLGVVQLGAEEGAQGYTVMRLKNMLGPIPKDDLDIYWIERFKAKDDFMKHKESKHLLDAVPKIKELSAGDITGYEFSLTKHFQK